MTQLQRVKISALGTYVPPRLLTNADLEKMVDTNDEWIMSRVGIQERHIVDKGVGTSDLAAEAARRALAQRGIEASDLDAIIVATVTPDMMFPSTACLVQDKIGAKKAWGFDLPAGCSQFVYALQVGAQFCGPARTKKSWSSAPTSCRRSSTTPTAPPASSLATARAPSFWSRLTMPTLGLIDFMHEVDGSGGVSSTCPAAAV